MSLDYEEEVPLTDPEESTGSKRKAFVNDKTKLTVYNKEKISVDATKLKVLLELEGNGNEDDTPEVDLVTVLDFSGSMNDDGKIGKLKNAMQYLIKKLSSNHRLSVVTFSTTATRRCHLRRMTEQGQDVVWDMVNNLHAGGGTNIAAGLRVGLQVLKERKQTRGRIAAIMLMSDGNQGAKYEDAKDVPVDNFPVYTFGFGKGNEYNPEVLNAIATKSRGTFSVADVDNTESSNLNAAFAISLGGLLTTVVQDLKLKVTRAKSEIRIDRVRIKLYPIHPKDDNSQTISFGHLYTGEKRRVLVELDLPATTNEAGYQVLRIHYSFDYDGELYEAKPITINVFRTNGAVDAENPEVENEGIRNDTVDKMRNATYFADQNNFPGAKSELGEAQALLEAAAVNLVTNVLKSQVGLLLELMQNPKIYNDKGRHIALALLTSHDLQRMAAIGDDPTKDGLFDTPTVKEFVKEALKFSKDPNIPIESFDIKKHLNIPDPAPVKNIPDPTPVKRNPDPAPTPVPPAPAPEPTPDQIRDFVKKVYTVIAALFVFAFEWLSKLAKLPKRD